MRKKLTALTIAAAAAGALAGGAAPAQAQCTQVEGVDGCLESYVCGPAYHGQDAVLDALRKQGITLGLPPFYCTM